MYRQIMIPTEQKHSIDLPKDMYGLKVEIIAFPIPDENHVIKNMPDADAFYDKINLDFSGYKFDRNEANER